MSSALRRWIARPLDSAKARHALLLNLLATPGLGSLVAGRRLAGRAQLLLASAGFGLFLGWWIRVMVIFYSLMSLDAPGIEPNLWHGLWKGGALLFAAAWLWSLVTSLSLLRQARAQAEREMKEAGDQPPVIT
jgi:hypothetical protein